MSYDKGLEESAIKEVESRAVPFESLDDLDAGACGLISQGERNDVRVLPVALIP
jgi:hypothetical protein